MNLNASVQGSVSTSTYSVTPIPYNPYPYSGGNSVLINIDDTWSSVINMPFCFEYFGTTYSQIVIGSNAIVSFNTTYAGGYCQWPISAAIPSSGNPVNSIMAPFHDIDPSVGTPTSATDVNWQVFGTAPCREMVISWNDVAMFSCNNLIATSQVILHETTNIIDIYIQDKPLCSSWNSGAAIEGIQDASGTTAFVVPGRNYPTQWTATNDGYRFMPAGPPNYTIQWTGPSGVIGTTNTVNVCPTTTTTYTATVTNSSCSGPIVVSDQVTVNVTNALNATTGMTPASCSGSDGSASVTPSGGSGNYTYSWAPSGGTGSTASNLAAGSYTCTITDATTGCSVQSIVNVTNAGGLSATLASTNSSCNGSNNGTASVTASGGSGTYTYSWAPSGGSNATATGLAPGTYTCTITDSNGCTSTQVATITEPQAVTATPLQTDVACNGGNTGSATVMAAGGSGTYTYLWAPSGGTNATENNLAAGSYSCTVTDANGCSTTATFSITQPSALSDSITVVNAGCLGNGSATSIPSGGTAPYSYSWSSGGTGQTENNLPPGTYTCTVTDANGCVTTQTATIQSASNVTAAFTSADVSCFGGNNGTATVTASGGSGIYTYSWSPSGGSGATATGLAAGTYTCTITDSNGCTATQVVTITQPTQITASGSTTAVSCNGSADGTATVTASGGAGGFTYSWAPSGGPNATANGLAAGSYTCTITDASGCSTTQSVTVTQPNALNVLTTGASVCAGGSGTIFASTNGGVSPYTYAWSNGPTAASQTVSPATNTTYSVTVTDANGCTISGTVAVTVNAAPVASISSNATNGVFGLTGPTGQLCFFGPANVSTWAWTLDGTDTSTVQSPCVTVSVANTGQYCADLVVSNSFGCYDTANICVEISNAFYSIPNVFTPNADGTNDVFLITNTGMKSLRCEIYNRWGELVYEWDGTTGSWDGKTKSGGEASDGVYYFTAHLVDFGDKLYEESGFVHLIRGN